VTPVLLTLALVAAPELWVATQGLDGDGCDAGALAAAIHTQRPGVAVHPWQRDGSEARPPDGAMRVVLSAGDGVTHLDVTGGVNPIARSLPAADGCKRNVEIAALIVDGALDDLRVSGSAPPVDSLAPPVPFRKRSGLAAAFGGGVEQGPVNVVASLDVQGAARYRFLELTLDADLALPSSTPSVSLAPEMGNSSLSLTSLTFEVGFGFAPRLGPGRASADLLLGASLAFASSSASPGDVFQRTNRTSSELFGGLRLGYVFDLPHGLFVGARVEERLAPVQASFEVYGTQSPVSTRVWTLQGLGLVGYRFL
jgi:hypothetical protein